MTHQSSTRGAETALDDLRRNGWPGGRLLAFSALDGPTDYRHGLVARMAVATPGVEVMLPDTCRIRFPQVAGTPNVVAGDWFRLGSGAASVRGVLLDAHHLLIEGACDVTAQGAGIAVVAQPGRTLVAAAAHADPEKIAADVDAAIHARSRWLESVALPAGLPVARRQTLHNAWSVLKTQVCSAEGRIRQRWTTPDRWPHRNMWLWDSAFHAIGWRHTRPDIARAAIAAVLDMQAPDGFVAHMMQPNGTSAITQPPVLALGVKLVQESAPDHDWLATLYPKLCAYVDWILRHRDADGDGLLEWQTSGDPHCRCDESGMDNSPRFDGGIRLAAVDLNAFVAHECEVLAEFATTLGLPEDAARWTAIWRRLCGLIGKRLWSEAAAFFVDYNVATHRPSGALASSGFLPLLCGAASPAQAARLAAHLADPTMFGTVFPVPSIAARDHEHYAKDMWRGPVWINLNWLIAAGFERYGLHDVAATLRTRTIERIEEAFARHGTFFEFYDDRGEVEPPQLLRKGRCAPEASPYHQVIHDYGWTVSLYIDLVHSLRSPAATPRTAHL